MNGQQSKSLLHLAPSLPQFSASAFKSSSTTTARLSPLVGPMRGCIRKTGIIILGQASQNRASQQEERVWTMIQEVKPWMVIWFGQGHGYGYGYGCRGLIMLKAYIALKCGRDSL
ncbi:hypothetical protein KSS87_016697 [Heliosperma pusillum]|nr:hypothetical protein KSS87_016697 [Heliosperma pusillum]